MSRQVVYCVRSGSNGIQAWHEGEVWAREDPIVKANPSFFSDDPDRVLTSSVPPDQLAPDRPQRGVEDMSAAPGERRNVRVPRTERG